MYVFPACGVGDCVLVPCNPYFGLVVRERKVICYNGRDVRVSAAREGPSVAARDPRLGDEVVMVKNQEILSKGPNHWLINDTLLGAKSVEEILDIVSIQLQNMNDVNLATAFYRIGKISPSGKLARERIRVHPIVMDLVWKIRSRIEIFSARSLAGMCWAHAALRHGGRGFTEVLFDQLGEIIVRNPGNVGASEISSLVCACGKLGRGKEVLNKIAPVIGSKLPFLGHRAVVHIVWACAKVDYRNEELLLNCVEAIRSNTGKLTFQGKANLIWGCAKLHIFDHPLFLNIAQSCQGSMHGATPPDIGNFAWGFAKLVSFSANVDAFSIDAHAENVIYNSEQFYCTLLSDLGLDNAFKTLCFKVVDVLNGSNTWSRQSKIMFISSVMWSLATVRWKDDKTIKIVLEHAKTVVDYMGPRAIATILWSMAKLRTKDGLLMDALADRGQQVLALEKENLGQNISMCLYSYAYLNHTCSSSSRAFILVLQDSAVDILPSCKPQVVANVAWAAVAVGSFHTELLEQINKQVLLRTVERNKMSFKDTELSLLHQVQLCLRVEAPNLAVPLPDGCPSSELLKIFYEVGRAQRDAETKWVEEVIKTPKISDLHLEVVGVLDDAGFECTLEHIDGYPIDIALLKEKIAVEVDGPFQFTRNTSEPLGVSLLKRRVLEGRGWKVISIPHFIWMSLRTKVRRSVYLQNIIEQLDCQRPAKFPRTYVKQKETSSDHGALQMDSKPQQPHDHKSDQGQNRHRNTAYDKQDLLSYKLGAISAHGLLVRKAKRNIKRRNPNDSGSK